MPDAKLVKVGTSVKLDVNKKNIPNTTPGHFIHIKSFINRSATHPLKRTPLVPCAAKF